MPLFPLNHHHAVPATPEQDEFVRLLTEHQASLRAYVYSLMAGGPGTNDVLQETNITLWHKRDKFRLGTNFTAWSFAVARFRVLEHRRKVQRRNEFAFHEELAEQLAFNEEDLAPDRTEMRSTALEACMKRLSPKHRELIELRYDRAVSIKDFARENGRSAGSIRVTLHQIRANLRKCINRRLRLEGAGP